MKDRRHTAVGVVLPLSPSPGTALPGALRPIIHSQVSSVELKFRFICSSNSPISRLPSIDTINRYAPKEA